MRFLSHDDVLPPVYLSYSSNLIENAKKLTTSLFDKNHSYTDQLKKISKSYKADVEPLSDKIFFVFLNLVRDCIGEKSRDILGKRFRNEDYVSYTKFRELWEEKFGKIRKAVKEYGPALSWHVIRTYIKGWDSEAYCAPEDYSSIGRANKSVSDDTFKTVFEKVWEGWYQELQKAKGLWDDQDLVRYCLTPDDDSCNTYVFERFSAVLCDESQDFTRIETDFILRLSLFSNRRIRDDKTLRQLPFVFAGDEFQTLNPTGFSWNSLRSYFTERLIHSTEFGKNVGAPEPVSLTRNYRSTAPIVKLGNRIQLLKQTRCGGDLNTTPQVPYFAENEADSVYCLNPENPLVWKKLGDMHVYLIIPCADGQSPKDFIESSPIKGMIEFYTNGAPKNITILNPIQAKGLDYPCVAVYGFDDVPDLQLGNLCDWFRNPRKDSETKEIELKYFLSNAYVSATRAKSKLFIISKFDGTSFWAFAFSSGDGRLQSEIGECERSMLGRLHNAQNWQGRNGESLLGFIVEGDVNAVTGENIVDAGEVARTTEDRGMALHDAGLMRQAAARYREHGEQVPVMRCEAWAYSFERKHLEAAKTFEKATLFDNAVKEYWLAYSEQDSETVLNAVAKLKGQSERLEIQFAEHATAKVVTLNDFKRDLDSLCGIFTGERGEAKKEEASEAKSTWQAVLERMFKRVGRITRSDKPDVIVILDFCTQLKDFGFDLDVGQQARLAFNATDYQRAVDLWEKLHQRPKEYHQAKIETTEYPDNLQHLESSGIDRWQEQIIEAFRGNNNIRLSDQQKRIVANAVMTVGTVDEIKQFLPFVLAISANLNDCERLIHSVTAKDVPINDTCVHALLLARWTDLSKWKKPQVNFTDFDATMLLITVDKLKYVRSPKFLDKLNDALKDQSSKGRKVIDVMDEEFKQFSRSLWNQPLFTEVGSVMEKRGRFLDALRYYDWVIRQSDDQTFRHEMDIRWIVCKERQAQAASPRRTENSERSAEYEKEARDKREELGISPEESLPIESKFDRWEWLFMEALKISPQKEKDPAALPPVKPKTGSKNKPKSTPSDTTPVVPASPKTDEETAQTLPNKFFEYNICGYTFRFNPAKFELIITYRTETEDLHVKIIKGAFPDNPDFVVIKDMALIKADGSETPFSFVATENEIRIIVTESGVEMRFASPNKGNN